MLGSVLMVLTVALVGVDATFYYLSSTVYVHENKDGQVSIDNFYVNCQVRTTCSYWTCNWGGEEYRCYRRYYTCYPTYACNRCTKTSGDERFYVNNPSGGWTDLMKRPCATEGCGPTCTGTYCLNQDTSYPVTIYCWLTGYSSNGYHGTSVTVSITKNSAPYLTSWESGNPFNVWHITGNEVSSGTKINRIFAADSDAWVDGDTIRYRLADGVDPSYNLGTTELFTFDTTDGSVYVNRDLSGEFSNYYYMTVCVFDRREDENCYTLNITLHACYQTPNCSDQTDLTIHDTHGLYTNHGTTNTLYLQIYPQPDPHFLNFHNGWHQLNWVLTRNDFDNLNDPPVKINFFTGEIYVDRNISIFPSYPYEDLNMTVEVSNPSASCYNTTCDFFTRVWFTNWPIEIRSLPASISLHEDTDAETLLHVINMFDYNYHWEDNFTCELTDVSSNSGINEDNLFDVRQVSGGAYTYDSWRIYKLQCQDPDCGYLYDPRPFFCNQSIGCMNHNDTQEYYLTVTCWDGYNSTDVDVFTFRPIQNRAPYYTNLPKTIILDSDDIANLDIVYSMTYWDLENENLYYNYTYIEDPTGMDPGFWLGTTWGNYYNSLGNISATIHFWNTTNSTYTIYICGHERRNMICDYLYIHVQEYCGPSPTCNGTTVNITNEFAVGGELFDVSTLVANPSNGGSYTGLSYAIASSGDYFMVNSATDSFHRFVILYEGDVGRELFDVSTLVGDPSNGGPYTSLSYAIASSGDYFVVNSATGSVTLNSALPAVFPSKTYSISAYVYDEAACEYAQCTTTINVEAVNNEITIDNLDAGVNIHEDTTEETSLYTLATSDNDNDQTVDCSITLIAPNESVPDHFILKETYSDSEVFEVHSKANPGFTSATLLYLVTIECDDDHGSTATGTLSVTIDENQPPTLTNLGNPTTVSIDPATWVIGDLVHTVSTSDTENDVITFNCTVANTEVPFQCNTTRYKAYVTLSRSLDVVDDDGVTYSIDICISDAKHHHAACGSIQATLTSSRTYPYIHNLPSTVVVFENITTGTSLYDIDFTDPDVGETHSYTLIAVQPSSGSNLFHLNSTTGEVYTSGELNFEEESHFSLEFTVQDNYLTSEASAFLYVNVTNVNEPPVLTADVQYVNVSEGALPGAGLQFFFTVTDPDIDDEHAFSITNGSHSTSFAIDSTDGTLSLVTTWDLENAYPASTSLEITCTDSGGLSSTIDVTIEFADINDNTPTVNVVGDASSVTISDTTNVIDDLLTLTCNDIDIGEDGYCEFQVIGQGDGDQFFVMPLSSKRSVGSSATLRLRSPVSFDRNRTFTFTIGVSDESGPNGITVGVPVTVTYIASDPADPTKPTSCPTCSSRGKWLIGFLVLEAIIVAGLIGHVIWHFNFRYRKEDKDGDDMKTISSVLYSRNRSRNNPMPPNNKFTADTTSKTRPSAQNKSNSLKTATLTRLSSRQISTPSTSGLFSKSSEGPNKGRVTSDMVISNLDSSSSGDSDDSSEEEVTLQIRTTSANAQRDIMNTVFRSPQLSNQGSSGLPKPIYR